MGMINATEAARRLSVSQKTMRHYIRTGQVIATLNTSERPYTYEIDEQSVEALAERLAVRQKKASARTLAEQLAALRDDVDALKEISLTWSDLQDTLQRLTVLEKQAALLAENRPLRIATEMRKRGTVSRTVTQNPLPGDLVSWWAFADLHTISHSTISKAVEHGRIPSVRGEWRVGKALIKNALDAEGRRIFYELYHTNPHFTPCPNCPHREK